MSGPQFMPFYVGDYLRDTQHLTTEQHGAYLLLLFACWSMARLPNNDGQLMAITRCEDPEKWLNLRKTLEPFFRISHGHWWQKRIKKELGHASKTHSLLSEAGQKGAANRWRNKRKTDNGQAIVSPLAGPLAGLWQPEPEERVSVREAAKAKPQASNSESEKPLSEPSARAPARGNGPEEEEVFLDGNWKPVGRCAPLAASRPERPSAALKARRKELLRQKLLRFVAARLPASDEHAATLGLCGGDPEHSEQWWLDALDIRMRAEKWDDTREFWEGEDAS